MANEIPGRQDKISRQLKKRAKRLIPNVVFLEFFMGLTVQKLFLSGGTKHARGISLSSTACLVHETVSNHRISTDHDVSLRILSTKKQKMSSRFMKHKTLSQTKKKERCSGSYRLAVGFLVIKDESISVRGSHDGTAKKKIEKTIEKMLNEIK